MRSAPPDAGTATKPLARRVDRNSSKYSDRLSGRWVTTDTRPCTCGSMMKVRPVTRAASWMKARMSASRRFSTYCAWAGAATTSGAPASSEGEEDTLHWLTLIGCVVLPIWGGGGGGGAGGARTTGTGCGT